MRRDLLRAPKHLVFSTVHNTAEQNKIDPESWQPERVWHVIPLSTPHIIRRCARCHQDRFCSSDKFRVNANKKVIDAWLIYQCIHCHFTLNIPIITRTTVAKIDRDLFRRLQENDLNLAWECAFDPHLLHKMPLDWSIQFEIREQLNSEKNTLDPNNPTGLIVIKSDYFLKIPIFSLLREKLATSRNQLEKLHRMGNLNLYRAKGEPSHLKAMLGKSCYVELFEQIRV